jgi:phosphoglycolate phosphatase
MPKLLLFDIDGTLLHSGGAGARALLHAFDTVYGLKDALAGVRLHGQTDPQIIQDALAAQGIPTVAGDPRLALLQETYVTRLTHEMPRSEAARLMPGVVELLEALYKSDAHLALVTGNIEKGARIKLERFGLNRYFACGGFGCDSSIRRDLVPVALKRASAHFGREFLPGDAVVIGDTEKDIDCGRFVGARTVGVATGPVTSEQLAHAGADTVLADFSNTNQVVSLLMSI